MLLYFEDVTEIQCPCIQGSKAKYSIRTVVLSVQWDNHFLSPPDHDVADILILKACNHIHNITKGSSIFTVYFRDSVDVLILLIDIGKFYDVDFNTWTLGAITKNTMI